MLLQSMSEYPVLFRVAADPQIGLGHLQRCLSLAMALHHFDVACLFLTNEDPTVCNRVRHSGFDGYTLSGAVSWSIEDLAQTTEAATSHGCSAIIVDSDSEGEKYLSQLRDAGFFVCAIEDMAPHPFPCQMVVNGDAHARRLSYHSSSGDALFLLGPEYSILRPEFWEISPRVVRNVIQNVLITLGGSDSYDLMPRVLGLVDGLPGAHALAAIIGPFFDNVAEVEAVVRRAKRPIKLVYSPASVRDLMLEADLAVSAAGQTLYELACVGCPTVAVRMAANQDGQLQVFDEAGFVRIAGHADESSVVTAIGDALLSLQHDPETRAVMSSAGQRLVDGQGALRVARTILAEVSRM